LLRAAERTGVSVTLIATADIPLRDFMDTMRSSGNVGGGPPPLGLSDRNAFAAQLDTWLARRRAA
jgi:uncharacterized protein YaiI (UPF0178 family)